MDLRQTVDVGASTPTPLPPSPQGGGGGAIHTSQRTETSAKRFRKTPTLAEKLFWVELRKLREQGLPFRRQAPMGPYVVDFVCHAARLIIELDGGVHVLTAERDAARDAWLTARGYRVLRFANGAIIQDLDAAVRDVQQHLTTRR